MVVLTGEFTRNLRNLSVMGLVTRQLDLKWRASLYR